jgi:hypothetical protein
LDDQYLAGGIIWASGDLIALVMLIALFVQWYAHSQREARREDRRLDRLERLQGAASAPVGPRDQGQPARYDHPRAESVEGKLRTAGTGGQSGDDQ